MTAIALGVVVGTALQLQQAVLWPGVAYALLALGGALLALLALVCRRAQVPGLALGLGVGTAVAMGVFALTGARAQHFAAAALDAGLEGQEIVVVGRVASLPVQSPGGQRFAFVIEQATRAGQPVRVPPRVLLGWYGAPATGPLDVRAAPERAEVLAVVAGDRWSFTVRLQRPHGPANPHGFDRERWLWEQGFHASGQVRAAARAHPPRHLGVSPWHPVARTRQWLGERIAARVHDPGPAGVLAALVVGDQSAIDRDDWDRFRDTGVAHLMAISGLHVTLFAWLAAGAIRAGWRLLARRRPAWAARLAAHTAAAWGGVALAGAYALLAGWGVPAQRTVVMLAIVVALRQGARQWPWPVVWLLAMAAVLLLDPWAWLSAGFWLSFVAVGVLFATTPAPGMAPGAVSWPRHALGVAKAFVREQGRLSLALAPLSLWLFGQVSLVGLVANLFAVPWVTLLVTPLALLGTVLPVLWDGAAAAVQLLIAVLDALAAWPWAVWRRPVVPLPLAVLAVAGAALAVWRLPPWLRAGGALLVLPALLWAPPRPVPGHFEVLALDVGQGSAVLVRTATHALLYDTGARWSGETDAGERIVVPLLRALGERLDTVVVSHRDSDHAGGMAAVAADQPQARWLSSFDADPSRRCVAGQRWHWDGVDFEVLHPGAADLAAPGRSTNSLSCVLRVSAGAHSAWLMGDLPADDEVRLALARPEARASWLLAPHHGSATSSSPVLLNTLRPRWIVVQSGHRNRFGHPAPVVVQRYDARGIAWVDTPRCGAARWRSDAPEALDCERVARRRYWHHPEYHRFPWSPGPPLAILPHGQPQGLPPGLPAGVTPP